jgi:hypothetical protein
LSNNNQQTQKLALQCILTWRDPALVPYKTHLENLVVDKKYGDELARFGFEGDSAVIEKGHRKKLVELMAKLFWPKITSIKEVYFFDSFASSFPSSLLSSSLLFHLLFLFSDELAVRNRRGWQSDRAELLQEISGARLLVSFPFSFSSFPSFSPSFSFHKS